MPKATINTYGSYNFNINGTVKSVTVTKIFSEENVKPITKEVSVFEKYSSKVSLPAKSVSKTLDQGIER